MVCWYNLSDYMKNAEILNNRGTEISPSSSLITLYHWHIYFSCVHNMSKWLHNYPSYFGVVLNQ